MTNICKRTSCCGCGLCSSVCPTGAICMKPDEEGFQYPEVDKRKCISCGKCDSLCPASHKAEDLSNSGFRHIPKAYAAYKEDLSELLKSSAGGVANAIGQAVIEEKGVVFGVKYTDDCRGAKFYLARTIEELSFFNESKYVESDRSFLFKHIKEELDKGIKVLVIGLPCDIASVRLLVGFPQNLYTCRLICRSNTSRKALEQFLDNCEQTAGSKVRKLSLRYKEEGRPTLPTRYRIVFENGMVRADDFTKSDYGKAFQILARPSCFSCKAKEGSICSDLVIGDFQGLTPKDELFKINGVSLAYSFSEKGDELLSKAKNLCLKSVDFENTWKYNWMIYTSIPESPFRKDFSKWFVGKSLRYACHKLCSSQNEILDSLRDRYALSGKPVALWGAGDTAGYLYDRLQMDEWNIVKVFDGSRMKHGKFFRNHIIEDIANVGALNDEIEALILMIPSEDEAKLENQLKTLGFTGNVIHVGKYKFYREES